VKHGKKLVSERAVRCYSDAVPFASRQHRLLDCAFLQAYSI